MNTTRFGQLAATLFSATSLSWTASANQVVAWGTSRFFPYGATNYVLSDFSNVVSVTSGAADILGLRSDGSVVASGNYANYHGPVPEGLTNVVAVAASPLSGEANGYRLALKSDGTVVALMNTPSFTTSAPSGLSNVVAIAPGLYHALALKLDGTVVGWGYNGFGGTSVPPDLSNVVAIAAGNYYSLALRDDGRVVAWGGYFSPATNVPAGLSNVVAITAGVYNGSALKADGRVVVWGSNQYGQTNVPNSLSNVVAISISGVFTFALSQGGTVVGVGNNYYDYSHVMDVPASLSNVLTFSVGRAGLALVGDGLPRAPAGQLTLTLAAGTPLVLPAGTDGIRAQGYQWRFNGVELAGQTNMAFALNHLQFTDSGLYSAVVSNAFGEVTNSYNINVVPVLITVPPKGQAVFSGSTVSFSVTASGVNLSYQWQFNGSNLSGATNTILSLTNVLLEQAGPYTVVLSNVFGSVTSSPAILDVTALSITSQPASQSVFGGVTVAFSVGAAGVAPITYQWRYNGIELPGETNSTLTLTNVMPDQSGSYSAVVSNIYSSLVSADATLNVTALGIIGQPQNQSVLAGATVTFGVTAAGVSPISYQWRFNGADLPGETGVTSTLTNVQLDQAGTYSVIVSNPFVSLTSSSASLVVTPLLITGQPASQATFRSAPVTFLVNVAGAPPFAYQWQFNGADVVGAAGSSLILDNVALNQAGNYAVLVSNLFGSAQSSNASLSVARVAVWGRTNDEQANMPFAALTNVVAIASGAFHGLALRGNGTVLAWGGNSVGQINVPAGLSNVVSIASGRVNSLALLSNGAVRAWGDNTFGQANAPSFLTNAVAIAGGDRHALALSAEGRVIAWGDNSMGQRDVPVDLSNVVAIASGLYHCLALKAEGSVVAWGGNNSYGQTDVPAGLSNVIGIACGAYHSLAVLDNETVQAWGRNDFGQAISPADLTNALTVAGGGAHNLALKNDGTLLAWGADSYGQTNVPNGLSNIVAIACGTYFNLALEGDVPPVTRAFVSIATPNATSYSLSLPSQSGRVYRLEYKNALDNDSWIAFPLVAGNGGILRLTDSSAAGMQRFYRVRRW